jgi:hypothetical protein
VTGMFKVEKWNLSLYMLAIEATNSFILLLQSGLDRVQVDSLLVPHRSIGAVSYEKRSHRRQTFQCQRLHLSSLFHALGILHLASLYISILH